MDKNKEQEIKDFLNFIIAEAKSKGKDPNAYAKELGEDGMKEAYKRFQALKLKKAQKALHGAKLQYFRTLKNQCAEDEELYYYKKGGSVGCGCKKKEEGGEVEKAKCGAVAKFKKVRKGGFGITAYADAVTNSLGFANAKNKKKELKKKTLTFQGKPQMIIGKDIQRGSGNDTSEQEKKDKSAKDYYSGKQHILGRKCGGPVEKKACGGKEVVKAFKEKCGAKMKKHQLGGSLNRIPFMLGGTNKGGVQQRYNEFSGWDLVPVVGTYRDIVRAYDNPTAGNIGQAVLSAGSDILGGGIVGSLAKAAGKYGKVAKLLRNSGFFRPTGTGTQWIKVGTKKTPINAGKFGTIGTKTEPSVFVKNVPEIDFAPIVSYTLADPAARVVEHSTLPTYKK